jgi:hypothetical protein
MVAIPKSYLLEPSLKIAMLDNSLGIRNGARDWISLQVNKKDIFRQWSNDVPIPAAPKPESTPPVKDNGGRSPKYDWAAFDKEMVRRAHHPDGLPDQRTLTKDMKDWVSQEWTKQPSDSQIRDRVSKRYPS